ncbi:curli production assembly/transport component CsgF [uncultured Fibrella sp.]|uniref:curli production assembly/transport component CsgF n=1 Tax=uncultured Fibrella sp. TaxID=1284596 RepID=UPI0035CB3A84
MKTLVITASLLLLSAGLHQLHAQGLVYRPNNPAFGGNTFNYQWLLSSAQAQDTHKDPAAKNTASASSLNGLAGSSSLQSFTDNLQRQLLSRLSQNILSKQFGEDGLKEGTFTFGDMQVVISNAAEGVIIRINDGKGGESAITVPYL